MLQETLELKARRYGPIRELKNGKRIILPPDTFPIGGTLQTPPSELYLRLKSWQPFRRNPPADIRYMLFPLKEFYTVQIQERTASGRYKTKKANLLELPPAELRFALLRAIFAEKNSYNLWTFGPNAVSIEKNKPHTGTAMLTGKVKAMERGGRGNATKYSVNVTYPFGLPDGYYCACEDSRWTDAKEGRGDIEGACVHAAALQTYAFQNPHLVRRTDKALREALKGGAKFVLPFHFEQTQQHDLRKYGISREELGHLSSQSVDLSHLTMDVLISHFLGGTNYFQIGKRLSLIPDIYDPVLLDAIFKGDIVFEIVQQEKVKRDFSEPRFRDIDKMTREMIGVLKRNGYELKGHPLEFRDSQWETVAWHYEKGGNIVRVIPTDKFPPVFIYRKKSDGPKNPFLVEEYGRDYHPYQKLFGDERRLDDRLKQVTDFGVRIPIGIDIPPSLREWYKGTIHENFDGGVEGVVARVMATDKKKGLTLKRALTY